MERIRYGRDCEVPRLPLCSRSSDFWERLNKNVQAAIHQCCWRVNTGVLSERSVEPAQVKKVRKAPATIASGWTTTRPDLVLDAFSEAIGTIWPPARAGFSVTCPGTRIRRCLFGGGNHRKVPRCPAHGGRSPGSHFWCSCPQVSTVPLRAVSRRGIGKRWSHLEARFRCQALCRCEASRIVAGWTPRRQDLPVPAVVRGTPAPP